MIKTSPLYYLGPAFVREAYQIITDISPKGADSVVVNVSKGNLDIRLRVGTSGGAINWRDISNVTGTILDGAGNLIEHPRVTAMPPHNPTHLLFWQDPRTPATAVRLDGRTNNQLLMTCVEEIPEPVATAYQKFVGEWLKAQDTYTPPKGSGNPSPKHDHGSKQPLLRCNKDVITSATREAINSNAPAPIALKSRDGKTCVTLFLEKASDTDANLGDTAKVVSNGKETICRLISTDRADVVVFDVPGENRPQVHLGRNAIIVALEPVKLDSAYPAQRKKWGLVDLPDIGALKRILIEKTRTLKCTTSIEANIPRSPLPGAPMQIAIRFPTEHIGEINIANINFYFSKTDGWTMEIPPDPNLPSSSNAGNTPHHTKSNAAQKAGITFNGPAQVGDFSVYKVEPSKELKNLFKFHLVMRRPTGEAFLIPNTTDITSLTPNMLYGAQDAYGLPIARTPKTGGEPINIGDRPVVASPRSRRGVTSVEALLWPVTLPLHIGSKIDWSAIKNLSLRGGVNAANFAAPIVGGMASEMALNGIEQATGHQFSETTRKGTNLLALAETSYLWGKYGSTALRTAVLGAESAIPFTQLALSKASRGISYQNFVRSLPAYGFGERGGKWIGQEFFGAEAGSLTETAFGFVGGMGLSMGTELLLQLPRFAHLSPWLTAIGVAYLAYDLTNTPRSNINRHN